MVNKKIISIIALLTLLIGGLGSTQLDKLDYKGCSTIILKTGMDDNQKEIFDIFKDIDKKDMIEFIPTLKLIREEDQELFNRVYHYVRKCKRVPIMMEQVE